MLSCAAGDAANPPAAAPANQNSQMPNPTRRRGAYRFGFRVSKFELRGSILLRSKPDSRRAYDSGFKFRASSVGVRVRSGANPTPCDSGFGFRTSSCGVRLCSGANPTAAALAHQNSEMSLKDGLGGMWGVGCEALGVRLRVWGPVFKV